MGFCHLLENLVINMVKKLVHTATKSGADAARTAEATGDLIGNKIADKITSLGKPKKKTKKVEEIYIPLEKRQQIIDDLKLFWTYKMEFQKIVNLLDTTSDDKN